MGDNLEAYYSLIMMDGDRMGAWLGREDYAISYRDSFHPQYRKVLTGMPRDKSLSRNMGSKSGPFLPTGTLRFRAH